MNHPHFTRQVVADHQTDLVDQAHRDRLIRRSVDAQVHGDGGASHPRAVWARRQGTHVGVPRKRAPLALLNLLVATAALTIAVVAIVTDQASSGPAPTVVTPLEGSNPAVAPDDPQPLEQDVTVADQPPQDSPDQLRVDSPDLPRLPAADAPAGDCLVRRVVVRC